MLAGTALVIGAAGAIAAGLLLSSGWAHPSPVRAEVVAGHVRSAGAGPGATTLIGGGRGPYPPVSVSAGVRAMVARVLPGLVAVEVTSPLGPRRGTGVVFRSDGMVLTTPQLVLGATTIVVAAQDGRHWPATLVGDDPAMGVAVVKVPATLPAVDLRPSPGIQVGQLAVGVTVGNRATDALRISIGVLDALHQHVQLGPGTSLSDAVETDAPPRDPTGGVLLDERGRVIGLMQEALASGDSLYCVGVPIDLVAEAADQLATTGKVAHGWLGVMGADLAPGQAQALDVPGGVIVAAVEPGSPAARAGLAPGDVIQAVDGNPVRSMVDLQSSLRSLPAGTAVSLGVSRDRAALSLQATLGGSAS